MKIVFLADTGEFLSFSANEEFRTSAEEVLSSVRTRKKIFCLQGEDSRLTP